ncbi:PIN domain-containing protein [Puniceicoccaceae bacterium K14]|nr:PIN domain-containing protein [Puniceicoccaceae bacterium K14]
MFLPDVNIWLAASWNGHSNHSEAAKWLNEAKSSIYFCRITQLAFLRLVTHPSIMGPDALSRSKAWSAYKSIHSDSRIGFLEEPDSIESFFESLSNRRDKSHRLWTDDYLAAFAKAANLKLVTFDKALLRRYPGITISIS